MSIICQKGLHHLRCNGYHHYAYLHLPFFPGCLIPVVTICFVDDADPDEPSDGDLSSFCLPSSDGDSSFSSSSSIFSSAPTITPTSASWYEDSSAFPYATCYLSFIVGSDASLRELRLRYLLSLLSLLSLLWTSCGHKPQKFA